MEYPFRNLVFEGGGVKGIGHVGVLKYLDEIKILQNIKRFGGTSAGAITALVLGLGYTISDLEKITKEAPYDSFKDQDLGFIRDSIRLLYNGYGMYKGNKFTTWIKKMIEEKGFSNDITFKELYEKTDKEIFFQGTNISTHCIETFSHRHTPDMPVAKGVRISMSIPFYFKSVEWKGSWYVDGGILDNYPIDLFDWRSFVSKEENFSSTKIDKNANELLRSISPTTELLVNGEEDEIIYNMETLGIRLDSREEILIEKRVTTRKPQPIDHLLVFIHHVMKTVLKAQSSMRVGERESKRTIYVNTEGVETTQWDITMEDLNKLMGNGYEAAKEYISNYTLPTEQQNDSCS
ncbi:patatin-like phospholipase family protein [Priestia megaterium]|uniref:patatin-like phospholipase family protein n=1 Tax=Priestia megaterium TaxID=1404 RepID=UPI0030080146